MDNDNPSNQPPYQPAQSGPGGRPLDPAQYPGQGQPAPQPYSPPPYQQPQPPAGQSPQPYQPPAPQPQPLPQQPPAGPQPASQRNPLRIDDALLADIGLGSLPIEEKKAFQKHLYETLEMNVGMRLADQMTNEQLDEFETYFNARDDAGAFRWLETNFPNYKDIVAEEFEKLKAEAAQNAPHILAASQGTAPEVQPGDQPPQQ